MAWQKPFTDVRRIEHPNSYWRPVNQSIDKLSKTIRIMFAGYPNKYISDLAKNDPSIEPIGFSVHNIGGTDYEELMKTEAFDILQKTIDSASYAASAESDDFKGSEAV